MAITQEIFFTRTAAQRFALVPGGVPGMGNQQPVALVDFCVILLWGLFHRPEGLNLTQNLYFPAVS
jgi:hypothetical protein